MNWQRERLKMGSLVRGFWLEILPKDSGGLCLGGGNGDAWDSTNLKYTVLVL